MKIPVKSIILLIYFGLSLILITFSPPVSAAFRHLQEGMDAPTFEGEDIITGETVSLQEILDENVVVIVFWATWSQRSVEELEHLKELALKYSNMPFDIIAVNVEKQVLSPDDIEKILNQLVKLALPFPSIIDTGLEIFYRYGVIAVPSTAIVDSRGILRYSPSGYSLMTRNLIIDSVEVLLGLKVLEKTPLEKKGYQPEKRASRYYRLAVNLASQGMYEQALKNLEIAEGIDPKFPALHNLRGEIFLELKKIDSALQEYKSAINLDSSLVAAWAGLGECYLRIGIIDSAIQVLSAALTIDSNFTPAMLNLAECLARHSRINDAIDSLEKARDLNLINPNIHYHLGKIYLQANDSTRAIESFISALEILFPSN